MPATFQNESALLMPNVIDLKTGECRPLTIAEDKASFGAGTVAVMVARITVEHVGADDDIRAILDEHVMGIALPEGIAHNGDTAYLPKVHVHLYVAEDVTGNRNIAAASFALSVGAGQALAEDTDIR